MWNDILLLIIFVASLVIAFRITLWLMYFADEGWKNLYCWFARKFGYIAYRRYGGWKYEKIVKK